MAAQSAVLQPGQRGTILTSAAQAIATIDSGDYLLSRGGGVIFWLEVTDINGATITTFNVLARVGDNYVTVATFTALAITANGIYGFRFAHGARTAGANAYKGVADDVPPTVGKVQVVNTVAIATFNVRVESVG
jgi:hypothetical protein